VVTAVSFALAAAIGALIRHGVNRLGYAWRGTLAVNAMGSFALGALVASDVSATTLAVAGTGCCGSLTTFSMFSLETIEAHDATRLLIVVTTVVATVGAAALGYAAG
jgi:fluoride exporter